MVVAYTSNMTLGDATQNVKVASSGRARVIFYTDKSYHDIVTIQCARRTDDRILRQCMRLHEKRKDEENRRCGMK